MLKITDLDRLQGQLADAQKPFKALDGEVATASPYGLSSF